MAKRKQRLTIIVVPETGSRTLTLHIAPAWFTFLSLLLVGLLGTIGALTYFNKDLKGNLADFDELKKVNRLQQAEIEALASKAQDTQQRIKQLNQLEQQIRDLTGQSSALPSRGSDVAASPAVELGRGGPHDTGAGYEDLPTLSTMLPPDVRTHLFARHDTLDVHLRNPAVNNRKPAATIAQSAEVSAQMDQQLKELDGLLANLQDGKQRIKEHQDYLAHRPTGIPISGATITDRFGYRWSPFGWGRQFHAGIDLAQAYWTPIYATADGVVTSAGWKSGGYGYAVEIDHGYGFQTLYAHMIDYDVKAGQTVKRGQRIGFLGSTGDSTGPHVHYEIHLDGVAIDPAKYFN
ncbi:MAG TPA: peptidoglycan DD-metalloendopeptidase family protein [Symbiobacteriaceae bacterium]